MSLLVLLLPIALLIGCYRLVFDGDQPVTVDPAPVVDQARSSGAVKVRAPDGLPTGWRVSNATFRRADGAGTLRIGYLTPTGAGLQLLQTDLPVERLIPAELGPGARSGGVAEVPGGAWQRYSARPGERALVLLEPTGTTLVVGTGSERELVELASALR